MWGQRRKQESTAATSPNVHDIEHTNYVCERSQASMGGKSTTSTTGMDGALRAGEALNIFSIYMIGLLCQYAAVGFLSGALPGSMYPFLTYYLNTDVMVLAASSALLDIPWSLKMFFGVLSDNVPIFGYRRRPYMVIGWTLCAVSLFIAACHPMPSPYFPNPAWRDIKPDDYTPGIKAALNSSAQNAGSFYIMMMTLATIGYLLADCAADGIVVEYAQREPIHIRGRTQTAIYTVRTISTALASLLLGISLNSPNYGGSFSFALSFSDFLFILSAISALVLPLAWVYIKEERYIRAGFKKYMHQLWELIQQRAFYQVIAYSFFAGVFRSVGYVAADPITSYWIKASALASGITSTISYLVFALAVSFTGVYGLHWNWRVVIVLTNIILILIDMICSMLAVFDVIRAPWLWLGSDVVERIPDGIMFIIQSFVTVELAEDGNEGAVYGIISSAQNLAAPFATTIEKNINAPFKVWNEDILNDSMATRRDVAITIWISYGCTLISCLFLPLLPRQKEQVAQLKAKGGSSKLYGSITVLYIAFALVWSILANTFSMFESTRCLPLTGGCNS